MATNAPQVKQSADVKEACESIGIHAGLRKSWTLCQNRNRVMAVQAFLVTCDHTEIPNTRVTLHLLTKQPSRIFNKNRIGRI